MRKISKTNLKVYLAASTMLLASNGINQEAGAQTLACPEPLIYGSVIPCATSGTVVVTPSSSRSTSGCVTLGGAPFSRARCVFTQGFPFKPIQISVTPSTATMTAGANTMTVNNFNIITDANGPTSNISPGVPFVDIPIGATLNVGANQAEGTYNGTFTVNANTP